MPGSGPTAGRAGCCTSPTSPAPEWTHRAVSQTHRPPGPRPRPRTRPWPAPQSSPRRCSCPTAPSPPRALGFRPAPSDKRSANPPAPSDSAASESPARSLPAAKTPFAAPGKKSQFLWQQAWKIPIQTFPGSRCICRSFEASPPRCQSSSHTRRTPGPRTGAARRPGCGWSVHFHKSLSGEAVHSGSFPPHFPAPKEPNATLPCTITPFTRMSSSKLIRLAVFPGMMLPTWSARPIIEAGVRLIMRTQSHSGTLA